MSWSTFHTESERLAAEAEIAKRLGDHNEALRLYAQAADAESRAIDALDKDKKRTLGISVVSAVSLRYKAREFRNAEELAYKWLGSGLLPEFAAEEVRELLQYIWSETLRAEADVTFAPGQVIVAVKGGQVVKGGAPLGLIIEKVQTIQNLFFRTAEFVSSLPHRKRGGPSREIQDRFRPWLFQAAPGSYQFAVAVEEVLQQELFEARPTAREISSQFLAILRASVDDPDTTLPRIVPDQDYRGTFLKLTRNLAPTGTKFEEMEIIVPDEGQSVTLGPSTRKVIAESLRRQAPRAEPPDLHSVALQGVLRAVHLDQDWLEITVADQNVRVSDVGEIVDDVIGPMMNRPVTVHAVVDPKSRYHFRDIESGE